MPQKNLVRLQCTICEKINYFTRRNKTKVKEKLVLKKHCPHCRKHTEHKETK